MCTGFVLTLYFISALATNSHEQAEMPHHLNTNKKKSFNFPQKHLLNAKGIANNNNSDKRRLNKMLHVIIIGLRSGFEEWVAMH